jgi:hypothetical protein
MKNKIALIAAAASALALSAGAASAQSWASINQRQANLDARIDAGLRSGELTRAEANTLRAEFRTVADLEMRYRANGLSQWERQDLDRRFDALSMRIRYDRNDRDERWGGGWTNINQRQAQLDRRIDQGLRSGQLTRTEAYRLRSEFQTIARLETRYRVNGLSQWERADLDRRFDTLSNRIRDERSDRDRYSYGYGPR